MRNTCHISTQSVGVRQSRYFPRPSLTFRSLDFPRASTTFFSVDSSVLRINQHIAQSVGLTVLACKQLETLPGLQVPEKEVGVSVVAVPNACQSTSFHAMAVKVIYHKGGSTVPLPELAESRLLNLLLASEHSASWNMLSIWLSSVHFWFLA